MKAEVNESCIGCGMCVSRCPEVFSMDNDKAQADSAPIAPATLPDAEAACEDCPVDAIVLLP